MYYPQQPPSYSPPPPVRAPAPGGRRPVWPFVLLVVLPPLLAVLLLLIFYFADVSSSLVNVILLGLQIGILVTVVSGVVATIRRERANAAVTPASGPPAWPYVLMAVAALPWGLFLLTTYGYPVLALICLVPTVVIPMLVCGISCAVIRSRAGRAPAFGGYGQYGGQPGGHPGTHPSTPIGYTMDGQPIYPVVGYTPSGAPITADRAFGMAPPRMPGTNGLAIGALIASFAFPLAGIIMGHIARSQTRRTGQDGSGLALAALIVGYVFLALSVGWIAFLVAMGNGAF